MIRQEHQSLWSKILGFSFDDKEALITFSSKLAASQNWTAAFAQKAIEEYRKFLFLCCISPRGAAPSKVVDEVWHLHLTYTQSYWIDLCKNTIGKDLHHYPSKGGDEEDIKHRDWYKETLELYRSVFDADAPSDIWPPVLPVQQDASGAMLEDPPLRLNKRIIAVIIAILAIPFIYIRQTYNTWSPFELGGPHFLVFFPLYAAGLIASYIIYRLSRQKIIGDMVAEHLPADASVFQVTDFLYGSHRALQTAIVDLVKRGLLIIPGHNQFVVDKTHYIPDPGDKNPLSQSYEEAKDGAMLDYDLMMTTWYDHKKFSHPVLDSLTRFKSNPESFARLYIFHFTLLAMALIRCIQGIVNGRPIILLMLETVASMIVLSVAAKAFSRSNIIIYRIRKTYEERLAVINDPVDKVVSQFALDGTSAIQTLAGGALLTSIFVAYTPTWYNSTPGATNSDGGGSSCGSSCGGGGGCGGCSGS